MTVRQVNIALELFVDAFGVQPSSALGPNSLLEFSVQLFSLLPSF